MGRTNQLAFNNSGHGAFKSAHMLYLHAQKTGGSTLECATEGNPLSVRWTNMGHTSRAAVDNCIERCTFGEGKIPPKVVVMAREPYSFWSSRYLFAKACVHAASCTAWIGITSFLGFLTHIENHGNFVAPDHKTWALTNNETWVGSRKASSCRSSAASRASTTTFSTPRPCRRTGLSSWTRWASRAPCCRTTSTRLMGRRSSLCSTRLRWTSSIASTPTCSRNGATRSVPPSTCEFRLASPIEVATIEFLSTNKMGSALGTGHGYLFGY